MDDHLAGSVGDSGFANQAACRKKRVKPTILVVDQDYSIIEDLQVIVTGLGCFCQFATSAQKAMQLCASLPVDMIIIDLNLKDQSGLKVVYHSKVPFMVLTDNLEAILIDACIDSGALLSFLTKPLKEKVLVESAIKAALANAKQQYQLKINLDDGVKTTYYVNTAKGILMERFKISDKTALQMLQHENQRRSIKMSSIAKELVDQVNRRYQDSDPVFERYRNFLSGSL